jgi:hypothetical protein
MKMPVQPTISALKTDAIKTLEIRETAHLVQKNLAPTRLRLVDQRLRMPNPTP